MTIRAATADDIGDIVELWEMLVDYHQQLDSNMPIAAADGDRTYGRMVFRSLEDPDALVLVAMEGDKVVGYVMGFIVDMLPDMFIQEKSGLLADIFVHPAYRRGGYGRKLVKTLVAWFKGKGLRIVEWNVAANNEIGRAFWRSIGGEEIMVRMTIDLEANQND